MDKFINYGVLSVKINSVDESIPEILSKDMYLEDSPKHPVLLNIKICDSAKTISNIDTYIKNEVKGVGRRGVYFYLIKDDVFSVVLILPKFNFKISKIFSSSFLDKRSMVLNDFFHGTYIGLLTALLLKKKSVLLHASCINMDDKSHIFISGPQSGKTLLVKELSKKDKASVVSDDFLVLTNINTVIPLQISLRTPLDRSDIQNKNFDIFEHINFIVFSILEKLKITAAHRRVTFGKLFSSVSKIANTKKEFYLLHRNNNLYSENIIDNIINIMHNELDNLSGFDEIKMYLNKNKFFESTFNNTFDDVYRFKLKSLNIHKLFIPFLNDKKEVAEFFIKKHC